MDQHVKATQGELNNLAASRQTPKKPAATGQPLTHYHSLFTELLSWNNPRASAIAYVSIVSTIFAARYLSILRWAVKLSWVVLAVTVSAEVAGKMLLNSGFTTQIRPRQYYTVPRESLDAVIGDVHELVNFFVIESQRILFAENVAASATACVAALISYYLMKVVPYWGLAVAATTLAFFVPLVYKTNQELIDERLANASELLAAQTAQMRTVAQKHTESATQMAQQYMGDYTSKAQAMIRGARANHPDAHHATGLQSTDFPAAPKQDFKHQSDESEEEQGVKEEEHLIPA